MTFIKEIFKKVDSEVEGVDIDVLLVDEPDEDDQDDTEEDDE